MVTPICQIASINDVPLSGASAAFLDLDETLCCDLKSPHFTQAEYSLFWKAHQRAHPHIDRSLPPQSRDSIPIEQDTVETFQTLNARVKYTFIITARPFDTIAATMELLKRHRLAPKNPKAAYNGTYSLKPAASYQIQDNVIFTHRTNKAEVIDHFLKESNISIDTLLFVDNEKKQIDSVCNSLFAQTLKTHIFHYTRITRHNKNNGSHYLDLQAKLYLHRGKIYSNLATTLFVDKMVQYRYRDLLRALLRDTNADELVALIERYGEPKELHDPTL